MDPCSKLQKTGDCRRQAGAQHNHAVAQAVSKRESLHELHSKAKVSNTSPGPALHSGRVRIGASGLLSSLSTAQVS